MELLFGISIPVLLGVLLLLWKPFREVIKTIPQTHYMKLQALRIFFGIVFLVEVFIGELPSLPELACRAAPLASHEAYPVWSNYQLRLRACSDRLGRRRYRIR